MSKYGKTASFCLAFLSPALAVATESPHYFLACAVILFVSACGSVLSVYSVRNSDNTALCSFSAFLPAAVLSFGGNLIMASLFPGTFDNSSAFILSGVSLFFAAGFASSDTRRPVLQSLCFISLSAFAVIFLGSVRAFLSFIPLYDQISMGLVFAGIAAAAVKLAFPSENNNLHFSTAKAFNYSLCLACVFLLANGVFLISDALWSINIAVLVTALSDFVFSCAATHIFAVDFPPAVLSAASFALIFVQGDKADWKGMALSAFITALAAVAIITALSPALRRNGHSDAPQCLKGLPAMLLILGLAALAFGAF